MSHHGKTALSEETWKLVEERVGGGGYAHADDAVRAGLAKLERKGGMRDCDGPVEGEQVLAEWRRSGAL